MAIMNDSELSGDPLWALEQAIDGKLREVFKALPVIVQSGDGHTMGAQSALAFNITQPDGSVKATPMAPFADVPIHFPGGGGVTTTHPVAKGDEGLLLFTDINQDAHHQNGGENNTVADARRHSPADPRYIPGGRSNPRKLDPAPSSTSHQARSDNGDHVSDVHPTGGVTHASATKVGTIAGGAAGGGTLHTPGSIIKNAARVLLNSASIPGFPSPGNTIAGNMAVATKALGAIGPMASTISSMMSSVLSGGPAAVMANPIAAAGSALNGALGAGAASLTSALGGAAAPMTAAMSSMTTALSSLTTHASNISGLTVPTGGAPGLPDILAHADAVTNYFGADSSLHPPSVAMSSVLAPLTSSPALTTMTSTANGLVSQVIAGSMTVAAGATAISALSSTISGLTSGSTGAISTLQSALPALSNAMGAASALSSLNPAMSALGSALATPGSAMATLANAAQAAVKPIASEIAAATSFPDVAAMFKGAKGGF